MLNTEVFQTKSAKVIAVVVAVLLLAAFQVAVQARPAHAWEVSLSIKGAGKITEVTDAGLIARDCGTGGLQSPQSTPTGTVGASCSPGTPDGTYSNGWIVEYKAEALPGFQLVGWRNGDDPSSYNPVLCDGSNGSANYLGTTATNCRFQMFQNLKAQAVFKDITLPSTPTITGMNPSSGITNGGISFTFPFTSDPTFKEFQCSIDSSGGPWQSCSSGRIWFLSEGSHTIYVRSIDYSGNISFGTASQSFRVDLTAPNTTLVSNIGPADGSATQDRNPTFAFSSSEPTNATFECNLMGPGLTSSTFSACNPASPGATTKSYTNLVDGTYTFKVRAKDQATNVDGSPAQRTWTIDNVAPAMPVISSPANNDLIGTNTFTVSGTAEANSSVKLYDQGNLKDTVDADSSGNWSVALSSVSDGSHTYTAKAVDAANNTSNASAPTTVTVDASNPTVTKWTPTGKKVSSGANAVAFFSEAMNGPTVESSGTFTLKKKGTTKALGATVTYSVTTTSTRSTYKAVLNPTRNLRAGATYIAKLTPAATDLSGNQLVAKTWKFTVKS